MLLGDSKEALRGWVFVLSSALLARVVVLKSAICSRDTWWVGSRKAATTVHLHVASLHSTSLGRYLSRATVSSTI